MKYVARNFVRCVISTITIKFYEKNEVLNQHKKAEKFWIDLQFIFYEKRLSSLINMFRGVSATRNTQQGLLSTTFLLDILYTYKVISDTKQINAWFTSLRDN